MVVDIEAINPWDFVINEDALPDIIKIGISTAMMHRGVRRSDGRANYDTFENVFSIILHDWVNIKKMAKITGLKVELTGGGERRQNKILRGSRITDKIKQQRNMSTKELKNRRKIYKAADIHEEVARNKKRLREFNAMLKLFNRRLDNPDSYLSNRRDEIAELGYNPNSKTFRLRAK